MTNTSKPLMLGDSCKPVDMFDAFDLSPSIDTIINARGYAPQSTVGNRWRKRYQQLCLEAVERGEVLSIRPRAQAWGFRH